MSRLSNARISRAARRFAARLCTSDEGVAAVEFGLLAPLLLLMLIGTIELSRAISMDRKFGAVTSTLADLIAREKTVDSAAVTGMYDVVNHMMAPWDASTLKISIIPVKSNILAPNTRCVYAQATNRPTLHGGPQTAFGAGYSLPSGFMAGGTAVIVIESQYTFTPLFVSSFIGARTWTDKAILNPREGHVQFDSPDRFASNPPC